MPESRKTCAVVLAAGQGKRMKSARPKVLHEVTGMPMLAWVLDVVADAGVDETVVVIGSGADVVRETFADWKTPLGWVVQAEQRGTGHAVMVTEEALRDFDGDVVVVCGDNPLLRAENVRAAIERHRREGAACVVVTAEVEDPAGYGRIVRNDEGDVAAIVEHRDATEAQREIREINSGNYVFEARALYEALKKITPDNDQGEYYLTDVVATLRAEGRRVLSHITPDASDVLGINSRSQLADASRILENRIRQGLMDAGVTLVAPESTQIDPRAEIGVETIIEPFVVIEGPSRIGSGCRVGPFVRVCRGATLADGAVTGAFKELTS